MPQAPLEFAFLVEDHYRKRGLRHKVDITFVTPLDGAFTKPVSSKVLGGLLDDRSIRLGADFLVSEVDGAAGKLKAFDSRELDFDLLVTIPPPNVGQQFVMDSGLGNDAGFIPVDKHTLRCVADERVFVLGDASDVPTSKTGAVAHFAVEGFVKNFLAPVVGPMRLLKRSCVNHLGKLAFEQIYWRMLLPGYKLPVPTKMSMAGKRLPKEKRG